jgi:cadmium resistance protein CadD (predicted permease)
MGNKTFVLVKFLILNIMVALFVFLPHAVITHVEWIKVVTLWAMMAAIVNVGLGIALLIERYDGG